MTTTPPPPEPTDNEIRVRALKILREAGQISTSDIQRACRLGYVKAAAVMDDLHHDGMIEDYSPNSGTSKRKATPKALATINGETQ